MAWYAVYRIADGSLASSGSSVADDATLAAAGLGKAEFEGRPDKLWNPATLDYDLDPPAVKPVVTRVEFLQRFTTAERVGIRTAAKSDPVIEDFLALVDAAEVVSLGAADVAAGLAYVTGEGLLTAERATAIAGDA